MSSEPDSEFTWDGEPPTKRAKIEKGAEGHVYHDADVMLVASDGVEFEVHSYQLKAASPIFAHLLETSREIACQADDLDRINLSDTVLERGKIVQLLLDTMYGTRYKYEWTKQPQYFIDLIKLFDKYDCGRCRNSFRRMIGYDAFKGQKYNSRHAFALAAHLNDVELAIQLIEVIGVRATSYNESEYQPLSGHLQNDVALDLGAMSFEAYSRIPPRWAHALLRAALHERDHTDWKVVAERFKTLMDASLPK